MKIDNVMFQYCFVIHLINKIVFFDVFATTTTQQDKSWINVQIDQILAKSI